MIERHMQTVVETSYVLGTSHDSGGSTQAFPTPEWEDAVKLAKQYVEKHPEWDVTISQRSETSVSLRLWTHEGVTK